MLPKTDSPDSYWRQASSTNIACTYYNTTFRVCKIVNFHASKTRYATRHRMDPKPYRCMTVVTIVGEHLYVYIYINANQLSARSIVERDREYIGQRVNGLI